MYQDFFWKLLDISKDQYYAKLFMLACQLVSIFILLRSLNRPFASLFLSYVIISLVCGLYCAYQEIYTDYEKSTSRIETVNILFEVTEIVTFFIFFNRIILSKKKMLAVRLGVVAIIGIAIFFVSRLLLSPIGLLDTLRFSNIVTGGGLVMLSSMCCIYYYQLVTKDYSSIDLPKNATLLVSNLFLYSTLIAPFFFLITADFMHNFRKLYDLLFAAHYISFGCLFLAAAYTVISQKEKTIQTQTAARLFIK